jgi:signal transduction histidine kinase
VDIKLNPFRESDGTVAGVVIVGRDITERQQANKVLIEQKHRLRTLASELALVGQRERRRVAIGLHDQVGQALAMAKLKLATALDSELPGSARRLLEQTKALLEQSMQATRSLTFQLSSPVLQELGLEAALQELVEWFDAQYKDTRFLFAADKPGNPASEDEGLMLYEIARELLFNATKYAQALTVSLKVGCVGDQFHITIEDDGVGFDTACLESGPSVQGGIGYFSIRERLAYLGGKLEVESSIGHGTRIVVTVPLISGSPKRLPRS